MPAMVIVSLFFCASSHAQTGYFDWIGRREREEAAHRDRMRQQQAQASAQNAEHCRVEKIDNDVLMAAEAVYALPAPENLDNPKVIERYAEFEQGMTKFFRYQPANYKTKIILADPMSGLKGVVFEPPAAAPGQARSPYILAFAGTEKGYVDMRTDAQEGAFQVQRLLDLNFLARVQALVLDQKPPATLHIAGHSLGGALAQHAAYNLLESFPPRERHRISLSTYNALGAQDLLKTRALKVKASPGRPAPTFNPELIREASGPRFKNYFIEGDPVSKIGTHLGPTYVLPPIPGDESFGHGLANFRTHMQKGRFCFQLAQPGVPKGAAMQATVETRKALRTALEPAGEAVLSLSTSMIPDRAEKTELGLNRYFASRAREAPTYAARARQLQKLATRRPPEVTQNAPVELAEFFEACVQASETFPKAPPGP